MSRLAGLFAELKNQDRKALVPYIVAGDPTPDATLPLMHELVAKGADILEIGVPFSDPMAEGPVIQLAHERALVNHTSLSDALALVAEFRKTDSHTPVVLMGYTNPVERMGYEVFAERAKAAGVDGLLTVDLPPEEAEEFTAVLNSVGIDNIFLLAPTTDEARIAHTAKLASGYLYCVSLKGVTGAGHLDVEAVKAQMATIRAHTGLPVTVGFGIKDGASAAAIAPHCEGVVVGSALVDGIAKAEGAGQRLAACQLIGDIRQAIDS